MPVLNPTPICGTSFVFSNGHGIAVYTDWYDDLAELDQVDWDIVYHSVTGPTT